MTYSITQNLESALADLNTCLSLDSTWALAYWQRAYCLEMACNFDASRGVDVQIKRAGAMDDINMAIKLDPENSYLYYDRAYMLAEMKDYAKAIDDYTRALTFDSNLAEAFYNRGLVRIKANDVKAAISDLSKAGELGLYEAYSILKRYSTENNTTKKAKTSKRNR